MCLGVLILLVDLGEQKRDQDQVFEPVLLLGWRSWLLPAPTAPIVAI